MHICFRYLLTVVPAAAALHSAAISRPPELHNPKYARVVLSKDGSRILPLIIDTPSEDSDEYKILYTDKSCCGRLSDIFKPSCKTDYLYSIFSSAEFSPIDMPAMYSEDAKNRTRVTIAHYANQERLAERMRKKLERSRKRNRATQYIKVPDKNFYMQVNLQFYQESGPWEYTIYRSIEFGDSPQTAPLITIDDTPQLELELVHQDHRKSEVGILVHIRYRGENDDQDEDSSRFVNNYVRWEHAGSVPEAIIRVKDPAGKVIRTYTEPHTRLRKKPVPTDPDTGEEINRVSKKEKDDCYFYVYKSQRGGSVEVELDLGPMFGVLTARELL